jgi:zinc transporter, ZIP family
MTSFSMGGECTEGGRAGHYDAAVLSAAAWAGLAASTLLIGAVLAMVYHASRRVVGLVMGFGAGALIASVSFELTEESFNLSGRVPLVLGLTLGALTYFVGDKLIERIGPTQAPGDDGLSLLLGATLDGIPESLIIGLSLLSGGSVEVAFLVSVAVSNLPESFASASQEHAAGVATRTILLRWLAVVLVSAVFGALGFLLFDDLSPSAVGFTQAFAAGALLTMVMDTMAPEAFGDAGPTTGLIAVAGFAFAYFLSVR